MKIVSWRLIFVLWLAGVLMGCQSPQARRSGGNTSASDIRNNCYSLLHQLLEDQKNVGLLRFIKREQSDVKNLVKKIAAASGDGSKMLENFAKQDSSINLQDSRLPSGESATREAIASTRKKELLSQSGDEFERSLLLAQAEALSYAWHLAKVAAENEVQSDRARAVAALGEEMKKFHQDVVMLLAKRNSAVANPPKRSWLRDHGFIK